MNERLSELKLIVAVHKLNFLYDFDVLEVKAAQSAEK